MSVKIERLQQAIKFKVAMLLQRDINDPRMSGLITITKVKLSRDLKHCTVYYSVLGDAGAESKAHHLLDDARPFIQGEVASSLRTRTAPTLAFEYDESIAGSVRIAELLKDELPAETAEEGDADPGTEESVDDEDETP